MKLSKEKHIRSAVANEEQNIGGVLYHVPGTDTIDLKDQMLIRDRDVKQLYKVFNQIQVGNNLKNGRRMKSYLQKKMSAEHNRKILK